MRFFRVLASCVLFLPVVLLADGPADNLADKVRQIPKPGIDVPVKQRNQLFKQLATLNDALVKLRQSPDERTHELIPDVEIFFRAVSSALRYDEFFAERELTHAAELLDVGQQRAEQLLAGEAPWTTQTGLVVRGYRSKIDRTVQPYGLVVPETWRADDPHRLRCDLWFHGRGETLSEVNFIYQRLHQRGQYAPDDTLVLHPYGRYSNAFKFAGEVDVLEALDSVKERYPVHPQRISVRGFSMGGAACWQFAVHYPDRWFAANPGAGFSETPEFLRTFQQETLDPTWYEEKLWRLYDCTGYAANLYHCPTVAYSGEIDRQKQAADIMAEALAKEGLDLLHVIGPQTAHKIHPDSAARIERVMANLAERPGNRLPRRLRFVTYTLKYNRMHWLTVDALDEHWEEARVEAELSGRNRVRLVTRNVSALTLEMPSGTAPFEPDRPVTIEIDGQKLGAPRPKTDWSWRCRLVRQGETWAVGEPAEDGLRKKHDLQGPVDDAFMDSFVIVRPTGEARHPRVQTWSLAELEHASVHWRRHFRGDPRVKDDVDVDDDDIAGANLVLFGDPQSNRVLGQIAAQLPIQWNEQEIVVGDQRWPAETHAAVLIYPNPLNPSRYVVLNSGFTFREYDYLNNARQVPKLPDWAVVDLTVPPHSRGPGRIAEADFFDEQWQLKPARRAPVAARSGGGNGLSR